MRRRDFIGGLAFLLLALLGVRESLRLPLGSWQNPEPGLFPLLLSLLLAAMASALLASAVTWRRPAEHPEAMDSHPGKVWWTLAALLGFYVLMEPAGFLLSSFLLLVFLLRAISRQGWPLSVGVSAVAALSTYLVFDRLLKLPLPKGLLAF